MDKTTLVGPDLQEGWKLLKLLDHDGMKIHAALWQKNAEWGNWQLDIVTPLVDEVGSFNVYKRIDGIMKTTQNAPRIDLMQVSVMPLSEEVYKSLKREFRHARNRALTRGYVGDRFIEEGYIYFVK